MPPTQIPEAQSAIQQMEQALSSVLQEWRDTYNSQDYKKGKPDARAKVKRLKKKYYNLKKVIDALKRATIKWGIPSTKGELGSADKSTSPPTITINETWRGMRDAVMAQILAHEAIHLLSKSGNSIDQEVRCRKKEMEVWEALKGDQRHALDLPCNNLQAVFARGEKWLRILLRGLYKGIPEHDVKPKKKPKRSSGTRRRRGRIRVRRSRNMILDVWNVFMEFFGDLFRVLFGGALTDDTYTFDVHWPTGYEVDESEGHDSIFQGLVGVGPPDEQREFTPTISVFETPDAIHGGDWTSYEEEAEYQFETLSAFNSDVFDANVEVVRNEACEVFGLPGRCIEMEYDVHHPETEIEDWRTRVRERTLYTQSDEYLYTLSLSSEASVWGQHVGAFDELVESFTVRS